MQKNPKEEKALQLREEAAGQWLWLCSEGMVVCVTDVVVGGEAGVEPVEKGEEGARPRCWLCPGEGKGWTWWCLGARWDLAESWGCGQ